MPNLPIKIQGLMRLLPIVVVFWWLTFPLQLIQAQTTGLASTYAIDDANAVEGDIICFAQQGGRLIRCDKPSDERIFGILNLTPQVVLRSDDSGKPIVREGNVAVNVVAAGGAIQPGDYITTSETPGKGQKASDLTSYVVGRSLGTLKSGEGQVPVALSIGPAVIFPRGNILDQIGLALIKNVQNPGGAALFVRYVTAGLVAFFVTFFAFNNFGRNISKGVEAVGRNPLARHEIQFIVLINIVLIAAVTLGGMILSLLIIRI